MVVYHNYQVIRGKNFLKLSTEALVQFEHIDSEDYSMGTPKCWDEDFLQTIDVNAYKIFFICTKTVRHGFYNRLTDYKKVWGLNHISPGIFEGAYDNTKGRVYFGIVKANGEEGFNSYIAPTLMLIPKEQDISPVQVFDCFKKSKIDFTVRENHSVLAQLQAVVPNSIILHYCIAGEISLSIYGHNAESLFPEVCIRRWENTPTTTVYRNNMQL